MRRRRPAVPDILFAMAATTATAGALVAFRAWWLTPAVALAALSPFLEWRTVPASLARWLPLALRLVLAVTFLAIWFTRPMPLLLDQESRWIPRALASVLATLTMVFVLSRPRFPDGRALVPAVLGLAVVTGADPAPSGFGKSALSVFSDVGHNGFADFYVLLAVLVAAILWAAVLMVSGPHLGGRAGRGVLPIAVSCALCSAGILGLPAAQPHVEQAMADAMSRATTGLASGATLGDFGELAVSRRRVLDLRVSNPLGRWRLRAEALADFDGRHWSSGEDAKAGATLLRPAGEPLPRHPLLPDAGSWFHPAPSAPPDGLRLRITQSAVDSWPLLLPGHVAAVWAPAPWLEQDRQGFVRAVRGSAVSLYGAVLTTHSPEPRPLEEDEAARALRLPPGLDPRIRLLAARLAPEGASAKERLALTVKHLQTNYRYTLEPGRFRRNGDPVAEFLFEKKQAYCEYFATAAVLLLRAQGVPARFVKGLTVGEHNHYGGDLFVVRESDAHAWVEAYVSGEGWVEGDPTPPADFAVAHAAPPRWNQALERLRALAADLWARATGPGLDRVLRSARESAAAIGEFLRRRPWALAALLPALAGLLLRPGIKAWRERRRRLRALRALALSPDLLLAIEALEQRWRRAGHPRPRSRGLREHARLRAGAEPAAVADLDLVDRYYAVRFGAAPQETRTPPDSPS